MLLYPSHGLEARWRTGTGPPVRWVVAPRPRAQPPKTLRFGSGDATAVASVTMGAPAVKARSS